ncbi:MFS transporter [Georgenia sp. SUBG003]|uniref:MFS transporter n=1 Tax=Georgenia sp. SUBG003 TaxID=1497974 RepID=UPI000AA8F256
MVIVAAILVLARRMTAEPPDPSAGLDLVGTVLSGLGLALVVLGILRGGAWGFVVPRAGAPSWLGLSPAIWLVLAGGLVLRAFQLWVRRRERLGRPTLVEPGILRNRLLRGGLTSFGFQYLLQAGLFFIVPLYLSVALGLSAVATGVRILPLSATLLLAAAGIPKFFPDVSPRRVVRLGFLMLFAGIAALFVLLELGSGPEIVTWPLLLAGLGIGALASQLGSVTVSSVPDDQSSEVGGLQNTGTNLGASVGTALGGAVLVAALTSSFLSGIQNNPDVPEEVASQAEVELAGGVPFISDAQLQSALADTGVDGATATAVADQNSEARVQGLRAALAVLAVIALAAMFLTDAIPDRQPGARDEGGGRGTVARRPDARDEGGGRGTVARRPGAREGGGAGETGVPHEASGEKPRTRRTETQR